MADAALVPRLALPVGGIGRTGLGWWGIMMVIVTESSLFALLLFAYAYCAVQLAPGWMPSQPPSLAVAGPMTVVAVLSSLALLWAARGAVLAVRRQVQAGLAIALLLQIAFVGLEGLEWRGEPFSLRTSLYGSFFFTITGTHLVHVVAGILGLALVLLWSSLGYFDARRHTPVLIAAAYGHFTNVVWVVFFVALYLAPCLT